MAANLTLTRASIISRKGIKYFILIVGGFLFLRFTILSGIDIYERLVTDPPDKPTVKFGKLPKLPLDIEGNSPENLTYTLETVSGAFPAMPDQATVYLMPKPLSRINSLELATKTAGALGFGTNPTELVETVYQFGKGSTPSILSINIVTGAFSISFDVNSDPQILTSLPPSAQAATNRAKELLEASELLKDLGPSNTQFLRVEGGQLVDAISQSEANLTKVNLLRRDYGPEGKKLPSVTANPDQSNVWFLMGGSGPRIIAGEYHHFPIDTGTFSTYPIKTPQAAWEDLKNGNGYIAKLGDNEDGKVTVREVSLAYFDPGQYAEFYQPVIVFRGDDGFVAYVPAVINEHYGK